MVYRCDFYSDEEYEYAVQMEMEEYREYLEYEMAFEEYCREEYEKEQRSVTHTADDEEPKCSRCDHFGDEFSCCDSCGPEHGWYGYTRVELDELEFN